MGAWGYEVFEDDSALDFLDELREEDDLKELFNDIFNEAINCDYLEYDLCEQVLVAAAIINSLSNKDKYELLSEEYEDLIKKAKKQNVIKLKDNALKAIKEVLSEKSELKELWEETDDFDNWKKVVEELYKDLENIK